MDFSDATLTEGHVFIALVCTCGIVFMIGLWTRAQTNRIADCLDAIEENLRVTALATTALGNSTIGLPYTRDRHTDLACFSCISQKTVAEIIGLNKDEQASLRGFMCYEYPWLTSPVVTAVDWSEPICDWPYSPMWHLVISAHDAPECAMCHLPIEIATAHKVVPEHQEHDEGSEQQDPADPNPDQDHEKAE